MHRYHSILLSFFFFSQIVFSAPSPHGGTPFDVENNSDAKPIVPGIGDKNDGTKNSGMGIGEDAKKGPAGVMPRDEIDAERKGMNLGSILASGAAILGNTQNMIVDVIASGKKGACPSMAVLFARGTFETGNVGMVTGPPFFEALTVFMNNEGQLAIQGVDYPADVAGFLAGGSAEGAKKMAALITETTSKCPQTHVCLSGYSQGAQVVHLATSSLPASTISKISSIILFGDPKNGTAIKGIDKEKVLTICHQGDNICDGGSKITQAHLSYGENAAHAAAFAVSGIADLGISSLGTVRNEKGYLKG